MTILTSGVGRIGKDAVVRQAGSDKVTGFSLAMDNGYGDKKETLWFDCSGWGKRYEAVAPYLLKGAQVFVAGEQGEREHEGKFYKTLRLTALDLVGSKPSGERPQRQESKGGGGSSPPSADDFDEDSIPFISPYGKF